MRQWQIAEKLGITQGTVCKDLKALHQELKESRLTDIAEARELVLDKLAWVELEAREAWEESKKDAVIHREKDGKDGIETEVTRKGQTGDPRYLERVLSAIAKYCELLGLDAPKKTQNEHTIPAIDSAVVHEIFNDPQYIEWRRQQAIAEDSAADCGHEAVPGPVCPDGERGEVEACEAPDSLGPGDHGHD